MQTQTNVVPMAAEAVQAYGQARQSDEQLNLVQLVGRLGADPEIRELANNNWLTKLRLAVPEPAAYHAAKASGQPAQTVCWHNFSLFGPLARQAAAELHKGALVKLEGRLVVRRYTNAAGTLVVSTEVKVSSFALLAAAKTKAA